MSRKRLWVSVALGVVATLALFSLTQAEVLRVAKDGSQPFMTIQAAFDAAQNGDVISVMSGVYPEQVVIRGLDDLVIKGEEATICVPLGGMTGQLVKIVNCQNFHFSGFTLDGMNGVNVIAGASNTGGDTDTRFYGLFAVNSSGHIVKNTIKDISWGTGVQQGVGIYIYVDMGVTQEINIRENAVTNFQKNGITIWGPVEAKIHKNTITGWGPTTTIAQNCLQLGGDEDMTASVTENVITKSNYLLTELWASTGVLALWGNDNIRIVNNVISECQTGIYVASGSSAFKIINNTFSANVWDFYSYEDDTKAHANKYD
jgi:parallel beta-helix repeat protein